MFTFILCAILLALTTDVVQSKYVFHPEINGWLKAHHFVATWERAYEKCRSEGFATLASPITKELRDAMTKLIGDHETQYFIGTSSTFYPGQDFVSIEGVSIEDMEVSDMLEDLYPSSGQCLSMDGHKIRIVSCKIQLPFMCYKKRVESMPKKNECGTRNDVTGYKFYPSTNSCYKLHGFEEISWDHAYTACVEEGGHLVVINDEIEAEVVRGIVSNLSDTNGHTWVTIGMRDRAANGDWITVHGQRVEDVYSTWTTEKSADDEYMCGRVFQKGTLDFGVCSFPMPFVCEKDPNKVLFPMYDETKSANSY